MLRLPALPQRGGRKERPPPLYTRADLAALHHIQDMRSFLGLHTVQRQCVSNYRLVQELLARFAAAKVTVGGLDRYTFHSPARSEISSHFLQIIPAQRYPEAWDSAPIITYHRCQAPLFWHFDHITSSQLGTCWDHNGELAAICVLFVHISCVRLYFLSQLCHDELPASPNFVMLYLWLLGWG